MSFDYVRAGKYFLLADFFIGMKLGLKYFFKPKVRVEPWHGGEHNCAHASR